MPYVYENEFNMSDILWAAIYTSLIFYTKDSISIPEIHTQNIQYLSIILSI